MVNVGPTGPIDPMTGANDSTDRALRDIEIELELRPPPEPPRAETLHHLEGEAITSRSRVGAGRPCTDAFNANRVKRSDLDNREFRCIRIRDREDDN